MTKQGFQYATATNKVQMVLVILKTAPNPMEDTAKDFIIKNLEQVEEFLATKLSAIEARGNKEPVFNAGEGGEE